MFETKNEFKDKLFLVDKEDMSLLEEKIDENFKEYCRLKKVKPKKQNMRKHELAQLDDDIEFIKDMTEEMLSFEFIKDRYYGEVIDKVYPNGVRTIDIVPHGEKYEKVSKGIKTFVYGCTIAAGVLGARLDLSLGHTLLGLIPLLPLVSYGEIMASRSDPACYIYKDNMICLNKEDKYSMLSSFTHEYTHHLQTMIGIIPLSNIDLDNDDETKEKVNRIAEGHSHCVEKEMGQIYSKMEDDEYFMMIPTKVGLDSLLTVWKSIDDKEVKKSNAIKKISRNYMVRKNNDFLHNDGYAYFEINDLKPMDIYNELADCCSPSQDL